MYEKKELGEVTTIVKRGVTPKYVEEDGYTVINQRCIRNNRLTFDDARLTHKEKTSIKAERYVQKWDVLVNSTGVGTLGRTAQVVGDYDNTTVDTHVTIVRPDLEQVYGRYLGYVMAHNERIIVNLAKGATGQTELSRHLLSEIEITVPDYQEQKRIASILSAFDDLIENNSRRIEILEEMARRIYREWFVHFRYPGHEEDELVDSDTKLGEIPEGWEVKELEDLCELTLGQSPKSEFYNEKGEGLPFHQGVKDFGDRYPTTTTWCSKIKRVAEEGDILFSVRAPVGRINIANTKMIIGRGLHSIRSKSDNQVFIYRQLKDKFQEEDVMGSGTIYKSVTKKDMLNLKLIDPGQEMIDKFEDIVVPIFKQIKTLTEKNEKLKETRDLLLPKLISGKIEVKRELNYDSKKD